MYMDQNIIIKKTSLSVDTLFRQKYNDTLSSDFVFKLPNPIENVISMKITAVELPNFWYRFSKKGRSNEFTITINNFYEMNSTNTNVVFIAEKKTTIIIPEGNYFDVDFTNFLNTYFLNIKNGLQYIIFEINPNKGTAIFRARNPQDNVYYPSPYDPATPYYSKTFHYSLDFRLQDNLERPLYLNMGWALGFKQANYIATYQNTYTDPFVSISADSVTYYAYLQSETSFGNGINHYLFLDIDDYNKNFTNDSIISCLENSYLEGNNIIARISVSTSANSINFTTGADAIFKMRKYYGPVSIESLHIRLLDKFGNIVDLNGNDFSFLIEMEIANM